jgi:hypothetical protein
MTDVTEGITYTIDESTHYVNVNGHRYGMNFKQLEKDWEAIRDGLDGAWGHEYGSIPEGRRVIYLLARDELLEKGLIDE